MAENPTKANLIAKILLIVGGIILFILLAVLILRIVPVAVSSIANMGSSIKNTLTGDKEEIIVTTNSDSVTAGAPLIINFEYTPTQPGQYFVMYTCSDGLFFDIQSSNGAKRIICNTPFRLGENLSAISLVPVVTKSNILIDSTVTIQYKDAEGNPLATGTKTVTIKNESSDGTATSTDSNPFSADGSLSGSTVTTTTVNAPSQSVDVGSGIKYTTGGESTYTTTKSKDLKVTEIYKLSNQSGFVFHVYNMGNTPSGTWEFSYTDAENPSRTVISPVQASLAGGQGLAVTVRFDGQANSNQLISIHVDPYNYISESNESNNTSSVVITGDRNNNSGDNSYDSNDDADLVITRMEVGKMSGSRFIEDDEIDSDDTAAVRFVVKNQGGESTGSWRFEITNLPYDGSDDTYRSKSYSSLKPGQSLEVIAEFDGIDDGRYSVRVEVDSDDDVDEEDERNNTESETLDVER